MISRKFKKLIRTPRLYFEDALKNRIERYVENQGGKTSLHNNTTTKVVSIPKITEHLMACKILGVQDDVSSIKDSDKKVYILTHVPFWRNALGNQCRIYNLAEYLRKHYKLTVIYNDLFSVYDAKEIMSKGWSNNIRPVIAADNAFEYEFSNKENDFISRENYVLRSILKRFLEKYPCKALIVEYITQEPLIRGLELPCLKIIDTHDIMSLRMKAFLANGRDHHIKISEAEEVSILNTFDKVIAIQKDELKFLSSKPELENKSFLSEHAVTVYNCFKERIPKRLVYIAGTNPANVDSIEWFINRIFPEVRSYGLELHIYGTICGPIKKRFNATSLKSIFLHYAVDKQSTVYESGDIVVNPVLYGGGLKIKTVEAMAHGLPMVTTEEGARGLANIAGKAFLVEDSCEGFIRSIKKLKEDSVLRTELSNFSIKYVNEYFSSDVCFSGISEAIDHFMFLPKEKNSLNVANFEIKDRTLFLAKKDFPLFDGTKIIADVYTNSIFKSASSFIDLKSFDRFLKEECIDRVFINNPYISEKLLSFYKHSQSLGLGVTTFDRGALPNSWFFDEFGFNGDSLAYSASNWNGEQLTDNQAEDIEKYIDSIVKSEEALEKQEERINIECLKEKLKVKNRKVLFIPFQRPNDTVVKYFSKNVKGMHGFIEFVNEVTKQLNPKDWLVIAKKHPLEVDEPLAHVTFVNDVHINDLLEIADATLQINSGVGLLSLLFGNSTYVCGESFYSHEGLAKEVTSAQEFIEYLSSNDEYEPAHDVLIRYVHFLKNKFYSFGQAQGYLREDGNGQFSPITTGIDFYDFRIFTE